MKKSEIMTRAHAWTRETVAAYPGSSYRATLAAALHELWSESKTETARSLAAVRLTIAALLQHAEDVTAARTPAPAAAADPEAARRAQEARQAAEEAAQEDAARQQAAQQQPQTLEEFFTAPGELQLDMIRRLATRCPDRALNRTRAAVDENGSRIYTADGRPMREYVSAGWAAWMTPRKRGGLGLVPFAEAVEEVTAEAWMILQRINPDPATQEAAADIEWGRKKPLKVKDGEPLGLTLARAADLACYHLDRQHRDRPGFYAQDAQSLNALQDDTEDASALDRYEYRAGTFYPSPEQFSVTREAVESYARSPEDLFAAKMAAAGYSHIEIASGAKDRPRQLAAVAAVLDLDPTQMRSGLGVSRQAVEKRFDKMARRRSAETRSIEAWMSGDDLAKPEPRQRPRIWSPDGASTSPGQR